MACSAEDLALYTTRLREAETALHNLMCGAQAVKVTDQSGDSVSYNTANVTRLRSYIAELKALIAGGCAPVNRGPIRPVFP